ncbi:MAG: peptidyl-prolyl cis-trans isomerase, partial [candidate division WOR-3 bacterium]
REVTQMVVVPESAKRNYFREHRNDFVIPEQVRTRQIQVRTRVVADSLRSLLLTGLVPFETLAKVNSVAPDKERGGDMGFYRRHTRSKEIDDAAFALKVGELSPVVKTGESSFVILKLEERRERKERTYEDVAGEVENRLRPQLTQQRYVVVSDSLKRVHVVLDTAALRMNRDTLAFVSGVPVRSADLSLLLERIPPMYRSQFETAEGKRRLLEEVVIDWLIRRLAEERKYWLDSDIAGQMMERERQLLTQLVRRKNVAERVKLSDKAIESEYRHTMKDYKVPEQVRAREIVLQNEEDARYARELLLDRDFPVSFDSIARTMSKAPSRWSGGDMGMIKRGDKPRQVENVLFRLKPKIISNVVKVNDSTYAIYRVDEHRKASVRPLTEVRSKIERRLRQEEEKRLTEDWLKSLRANARIQILITEENTAPLALESLAMSDTTGIVRLAPADTTPEVLTSVYFGLGESVLKSEAMRSLDSLVPLLKSQVDMKLVIAGFADNIGDRTFNERLALKRAKAVSSYLEKQGIDATRIETRMSLVDIDPARDPKEAWKNRRADVMVRW